PRYEPSNLTFADGLDRWLLGGSFTDHASMEHWHDYASTADDGVAALAATGPEPEGFASLGQEIFADDYLGAMVTFRAKVRVDGTTGPAGLFLRLGGGSGNGSAQDTSGPETVDAALADPRNKVVTVPDGPDWTSCQVTTRIPADIDTIFFGVFLAGLGRIEFRDPELTRGT